MKMGSCLSEEGLEQLMSAMQNKAEKYQSKNVRSSDEEWWNRRSSSEVRAMLIGTNYPRSDGVPYRGDETLIGESTSRAEGEGEDKKLKEVGEQVRVESDASWGKEGSDWQSHTYTVTYGDGRSSRRSVIRNVESSLSGRDEKGSSSK